MNTPQFIKPFGPTIYSNNISDDIFKLLNEVKDTSIERGENVGHQLAGFLENQLRFYLTDDQFLKIFDHIVQHVNIYMGISNGKDRYFLPRDSIWMNVQHKSEFNPMHRHSGAISGVIYLDIPPEILLEQRVKQTSSLFNGFGEIAFYYGDGSMCSKNFYITPKNKQILLFPAELEHGVFPFYSNVLRISIAFNLYEHNPAHVQYS